MRLNAKSGLVNGAATANGRLRFLGFVRNDTKTHGNDVGAFGITIVL